MKRTLLSTIFLFAAGLLLQAEDGHRLWLRFQPAGGATVEAPSKNPTIDIAAQELRNHFNGRHAVLRLDASMPDDDGFCLAVTNDTLRLSARRPAGLLYGAYEALRRQSVPPRHRSDNRRHRRDGAKPFVSHPAFSLRLLNHWDNLDGSIERGYAGQSIFRWFSLDGQLLREYARANASVGINGTVLNNVNASPKMLTTPYLKEVRKIADWLRPHGIRVYLSINFATPMALGDTKTADPLDKSVRAWWKKKAKELYRLVPDFGGFLVKANSEGQPGPGDYHRSHAEGANMLAEAVAPYGGIIMWRSFVYGANHKGEDRVKQAVSEFKPCDGQFAPNVILQSKNGPLDFQPREPYAPIFDQMRQTPQMAELQITQEYLGHSQHLVFLAPMWREFFRFVKPEELKGIAGVANIGNDANWCGHHFAQANWYTFGRLAWNPRLSSKEIAHEWLRQTFDADRQLLRAMTPLMLESREACVRYMMPLGLHHIFKFDHHYGPEPDGFKADYPLEWCPVYYHRATADSIGFDRTTTGSGATRQYREKYAQIYNNVKTCPDEYLLWFHRLPWTHRMRNGSTLWEQLQYEYNRGVIDVERMYNVWHYQMRAHVDEQRWREVDERLRSQLENAREWRDVCLKYFGSFAEKRQNR